MLDLEFLFWHDKSIYDGFDTVA